MSDFMIAVLLIIFLCGLVVGRFFNVVMDCVSDRSDKRPTFFRRRLIEAAYGLTAVLIFATLGLTVKALVGCMLAAILLCVAVIDFDTMTIPSVLIWALLIPACISLAAADGPGILSRLFGCIAVSLPMRLLTLCIADCFGEGDIKLMAVCGFLLGLQNTFVAAFIALLIGGIWGVGIVLCQGKERPRHMPFGPCLSAGIMSAYLFGETIVHVYLSFYGQ